MAENLEKNLEASEDKSEKKIEGGLKIEEIFEALKKGEKVFCSECGTEAPPLEESFVWEGDRGGRYNVSEHYHTWVIDQPER